MGTAGVVVDFQFDSLWNVDSKFGEARRESASKADLKSGSDHAATTTCTAFSIGFFSLNGTPLSNMRRRGLGAARRRLVDDRQTERI